MRVRCSATRDYRSNAVGGLELECTAAGLSIALCGVSGHREGYAPGPPVHAAPVCVPWPGVYATRLGDRQLLLSIDARALPYNRFLLGEFCERLPDEAGVMQRGALAYGLAGAGLLAIGVGLAQARALPHAGAVSTLAWAALVVALALGLIGWRTRRAARPPASVVLDEFCHELARYVPHHISVAAPTPTPRNFERVAIAMRLPRSAVAIAITLAAATLATLVGVGAARPRAPGAEDAPSARAIPERSLPENAMPDRAMSRDAASEDAFSAGADCRCTRHESLPWQNPLPRLTALLSSERSRTHDGHQHLELELALVNDGDSAARQLKLVVIFFETRTGAHPGQFETGERTLSFEGPLAPGAVTRWHVEGRGTSFDVIAPDHGTLAPDGSDAAPADAFAQLASSGARATRLHATQLLAFLHDPRAASAASALRVSASAAEADYLDRLQPPGRLVACQLNAAREASRWRLQACAFNASDQPASDVKLRWLAFDSPLDRLRPGARAPALSSDQTTWLPTPLPARRGRLVELTTSLPLDGSRAPRAFELRVEPAEALP